MSRNRTNATTKVDIKCVIDVAKIVQALTLAAAIVAGLGAQSAKAEGLSLYVQMHSQKIGALA